MIDHKVAIAGLSMVAEKQREGCVQVAGLIRRLGVQGVDMIAVEHYAPVDALGKSLCQSRFTNAQRAV